MLLFRLEDINFMILAYFLGFSVIILQFMHTLMLPQKTDNETLGVRPPKMQILNFEIWRKNNIFFLNHRLGTTFIL